jgi:RNA polymerase sigma-70 factor (ECF subfamily)
MLQRSNEYWAKKSQKSIKHFAVLYQRSVKLVYGYLRYRVNTTEEAEDLTSQVFMKAIEHIQTYNDTYPFMVWLITIARHTLIDYWRTKKVEVNLDEVGYYLANESNIEDTIDTQLRIEAVLQKLKPQERFLVSLRFLEGKSYKEIAEITGYKENNLMVMFHRLKTYLKD